MILEDDIMAVYKIYVKVMKEEFFSSVEDWHEPVQINPGPNVGDITTGYKLARRGRVIPITSYLYLKPMKTRSVALYEGPGPKGGLMPVDISRHWYVNLCCKIERVETEPGTFMSRPRDSVNRRASTHVYKGTTRQRFRDNRQQLESYAKRIRSLVIETLAIPTQLDVGFYLHQRGRTSIKILVPLVRFNPFKLTRSDSTTTKSFHRDICRDNPTTTTIWLLPVADNCVTKHDDLIQ